MKHKDLLIEASLPSFLCEFELDNRYSSRNRATAQYAGGQYNFVVSRRPFLLRFISFFRFFFKPHEIDWDAFILRNVCTLKGREKNEWKYKIDRNRRFYAKIPT